jgi:hypothetical protein
VAGDNTSGAQVGCLATGLLLLLNVVASVAIGISVVGSACSRLYIRPGDVPVWCGHNAMMPIAVIAIIVWFLLFMLGPVAWKQWRKWKR